MLSFFSVLRSQATETPYKSKLFLTWMDSGPPPWEVLIATPFLCGMVCPCLSFVHVWYLIALFVLYQVLHRFPFWTWRTYVYVCVCTIPEALWVPGAMLYVPVLVRLSYKHKNNLSCGRKFGSEDSLRNHKATRSRLVHSWNHFNADTILSLLHLSVHIHVHIMAHTDTCPLDHW